MANNEVKDQGTPSVEEMTFSDGETPVLVECDKHATYYHSAWHEEIEIKLVLSGTIRMMIGGALYEARSGDLLLINPYEIHSTIPGDADGTYHLIMLRTGSLLNFHADGDEVTGIVSGATRFCRLIRKKEIRDLCARLARECREEKKHYRLALRGLVLELIALLLRDAREEDPIASAGPEKNFSKLFRLIAPAVNRICTDYASRLTVEELAELCHLSKFYFCRVFRQVTGVSPNRYLTDFRLEIADVLLRDEEIGIAEAARRVGFSDAAYFSRCYKKNRGYPPKSRMARLSKQ